MRGIVSGKGGKLFNFPLEALVIRSHPFAIALRAGQPEPTHGKFDILQRAGRSTDAAFHFVRMANQILPVLVDRGNDAQARQRHDEQQRRKQRQALQLAHLPRTVTHVQPPGHRW